VSTKARILVVDDERSMQEFLEILLRREGYDVSCAGDVESALLALESDDFDVVISDLQMPGKTGLDLLHALRETSPETLARSMDFVQKIRKTPIVVNDSRGFFTSRVCGAFISEGHRLLKEGVPAAMIENCARYAGMPVGPLSLNDEVAIDLSWKIMDQTRRDAEASGHKYESSGTEDILELMVKKLERFGRKNGKGFYDYPADGKKRLWPDLQKHFPADPKLAYGEGEEKRAKEMQREVAAETKKAHEADQKERSKEHASKEPKKKPSGVGQ